MAAVRQVNPQCPPSGERRASLACQNPEKHLIIAGTGRAGTSFLVRYLTELGLDTELSRHGESAAWDEAANAGLETGPLTGQTWDLPYVLKFPWTDQMLDQILDHNMIRLDTVILPVRDL